jgi:C1A family cysteine protease
MIDENIWMKFNIWAEKHGKTYRTPQEKAYRLRVFMINLEDVEKTNKLKKSFKLALNKFSDLTKEEFLVKYLNPNYKPLSTNNNPISTPIEQIHLNQLPPSVDWTENGAVTGVKDQLGCSSSYAFSILGNIESYYQVSL